MIRLGRAELADALPALAALGVAVVWATDQGGYFPRAWYPGALLVIAVLAIAASTDAGAFLALPRITRVAIGAFLAYAAWTYLSITWADSKGVAWDAANQTLLYVVVFILLSRWSHSPGSAALVVGCWTLAMTALAALVLLKLPGVVGGGAGRFRGGLEEPFGYTNANAAAWVMAAWPALMLAACREIPPWLRGALAGAVVVLADTAVLSDSRGALVAAAIVLGLLLLAVPGRVRTLLTLLAPAAGIAATAPYVLDLINAAERDPAAVDDLGKAAAPVLLAALVVGVVVAAVATAEVRRGFAAATQRRVSRVVGIAGIVLAIAGAGAGLVAVGDPVDGVRDAWNDFEETGAPPASGTAEPAGFAAARYDYYRVAVDVFEDQPLTGIGAGNFAQDYAAQDKVGERPTSPHSLELRVLAQGGLVGAVLFAVAMGAALLAAWRALALPGLARAVGAGGILACGFWIVQGSVDWLWEFPAMAVPALGLLALAGAVGRGERPDESGPRWFGGPLMAPRAAGPAAAVAIVAGVAAVVSMMLPWIADREVRSAGGSQTADVEGAFRKLDRAARLNPLSEQPGVVAGTLALNLKQVDRARHYLEQARRRDPRNLEATLLLGAIASHEGRSREATRLLRAALALAPSDPPTQSAIAQARRGRVDLDAVVRQIADIAAQRVQ